MAQMFPKELSPLILGDPKRKGEVDTFNALSTLPDEYEVFYDRVVRDSQTIDAYEAPIDFIVLHEMYGMLAIEVKGGKIRINYTNVIEHFYDNKWNPKDPLTQLKDAVHKLRRTVKKDGHKDKIPIKLCVVFPNTSRANLGGKLPQGMLCEDDLKMFSIQIPELYDRSRKKPAWSRANFLDMHRRLQNAPQSSRENWGSKKASYKKTSKSRNFLKKKIYPKVQQVFHINSTTEPSVVDVSSAEQSVRRGGTSRPPINHDPRAAIVIKPESYPEKVRLKWWEIMLAIIVAIIVFLVVCWLFPNSFIHTQFWDNMTAFQLGDGK